MRKTHPHKFNSYLRKRITAFALSFLMVFSLFGNISFNSFAEGEEGSAAIDSFLNHVTVYTDYSYDTGTGTPFDSNKAYDEDEVFTFRLEFMETNSVGDENQFDNYTVFTYKIPDALKIGTQQRDDIKFPGYNNDEPVGDFVVNTDGTITVNLQTAYVKEFTNAQCWLTFDATLNLAEDETEKEIVFPDGSEEGKTVTIKLDTEPRLETDKSANYDSSTKTATYTVTTTVKNGNMSNLTITDVMGTDLTYTSDVSYKVTNSSGTEVSNGIITANGTTGGFDANIGAVGEDNTVTFTYTAKIDENAYVNNQVDDADNNVTITGDYTFKDENRTATSTDYYNIDDYTDFKYDWISKGGVLDEANNEVDWTVTINASREYALNGVTFEDVLGDNLTLPEGLTINVSKTDESGKVTTESIPADKLIKSDNTFNYTFNDAVPYTYEFTYSTPYDVSAEFGNVNLTNKSTISSDTIGTHTATANVPVGANQGLQKMVVSIKHPNEDGTDMGYVEWKTVITVPAAGLNNVKLVDTLPGVYDHQAGHSNYCTLDKDSVRIYASNGVDYPYNISDIKDNGGYVNGFTMDFGNLSPSNDGNPYIIEVTYKTNTAKGFSYQSNMWVGNNVALLVNDVEKSKASATAQLLPPVSIEKTSQVNSNGYITYTIKIDPGQIGFGGATNVTINDVFDTDKLEYVSGSATLEASNSKWFNYKNLSCSVTVNEVTGSGIEFNMGELDKNTYVDAGTNTTKPYVYYLTYQLKIKDTELAKTQGAITVNNKAELLKDGVLATTDTDTATYNNVLMEKKLDSYPSSSDHRFKFSVVINEGNRDLVENSDDISIVDVMSSNLTLDLTSVQVYEYRYTTAGGYGKYDYVALGNDEYTMSYDNVTKKITVNVPNGDKKHLKLTYGATISGIIGSKETVTNEVFVEGTAISDNIGNIEYTISSESFGDSNQSAGASGSKPYLEINKYDSLIASKVLEKATFELYQVDMDYDKDANKYTFTLIDTCLQTYTSDANGIAKVEYNNFLNNGVYLLRETKAPFGYEIGEQTIVNSTATSVWNGIYDTDFVFIFQNSTEPTDQETIDMLKGSGVPIVNSGGSVMIPNQRKALTVTATKNLVGRDMVEGEFKFKLTECDASGNPIADGKVVYGTNGEATMGANGIASAPIVFDDVTYEELEFPTADTKYQFYYILSEEDLEAADITYDNKKSSVIAVEVSVDAGGDMQISVNDANLVGDYQSGETFTNIYTGSLFATYDINASKTVNGLAPTDSQIFEFDLVEVDADGNIVPKGYTETVVNNKGVIDFATLSFTQEGDYYFKITERNAGVKDYTYDSSEYIVHIKTAVDNGIGQLVATADITKDGVTDNVVEFKNGYQETTSITVTKNWLAEDKTNLPAIQVELLANGSSSGFAEYIVELNKDNNYTYTFTNIPVETLVGDKITYSVEEKNLPSGYKVTYSGDAIDGFVITNTELTNITGTKTWVDDDSSSRPTSITVELYANGVKKENKPVSATDNWSYTFADMPKYDEDGTEIKYTVKEVLDANVANNYIVEYEGYNIKNTLAKTEVILTAGKELLGETLVDGQFDFKIELVEESGQAVTDGYSDTVKNTNSTDISNTTADTTDTLYQGDVKFAPITYTKEGTYKYNISEVPGSGDYTYDTTVYTAEVTVTRNSDNSLTSTVKYYNGTSQVTKPVFTNVKKTIETSKVDIVFSGTKKVTGTTVTEGFTFALYETSLDSTPVQYQNNAGGVFTFSKISETVNNNSKFTYFVAEVKDDTKLGYTFDDAVYKIDVTMSEVNGSLVPNYTYTKYDSVENAKNNANGAEITDSNPIVFTNTYSATGTLEVPVTKKYIASSGTINAEFKLTSNDDADNNGKSLTIIGDSANADGVSGKFDTLSYDLNDVDKTYHYTITETAGSETGVTYDTTVYNMVVNITDNGDGTLKVVPTVYKGAVGGITVSLDDGIVFTNTKTESGQLNISATKKLVSSTGVTINLSADQFEFTITPTATDGVTELIPSASEIKKNDGSGNINFSALTYSLSDVGRTYTYELKETSTSENGYTIDDTIYTVEVKVTSQLNANGGYNVVPLATYYKKVNGVTTKLNGADEVVFTNTYDATGTLELTAKKIFTNGTLAGNDFEFVLTENGTVVETVKNDVGGNVTFSTINYDYSDIGEHTYIIREKAGSNGNIVYSTEFYTVKVTVSDKGDGTLEVASKTYKGDITDNDEALKVTFTNVKIDDTTLELQGNKVLTGRTMAPNQFEFQLLDKNGNVLETVKNKSDGTFSFSEITFTPAAIGKDYKFTIKEVDKGVTGYTYDHSYYVVDVTVTEDNGTLKVTPVITKYDEAGNVLANNVVAMSFENTYQATASLDIVAEKTEIGGDGTIGDGEYKFTLEDEFGTVLQTVTNVGKDVAFAPIDYDMDDAGKIYTYVVKEVKLADPNVTYDTNYYTMVVKITDNGSGTLAIDKIIYKGDVSHGNVVSDINFVNTIAEAGTFVAVAEKSLTGKSLVEDAFEFKLTGDAPVKYSESTVNLTATNDGSGNVIFDKISYTMEDVNKTYSYKVSEVAGTNKGITYDTTVYDVEVEITYDTTTNTVIATPTITNAGTQVTKMTFANTYKSSGSVTILGEKYLNDKLATEEFSFGLYSDEACTNELANTVNDSTGKFSFTVDFDEADMSGATNKVITYYVREIAPVTTPLGYTYDVTVYPVNVVLVDMGGTITAVATYPNGNASVEVYNTYKDKNVIISKVDMSNSKELPGALLIITDKDGKEVAKWTSTEQSKSIPATTFVTGEEYTLTEITAPDGYNVAESIVFKVDSKGDVYVKNSEGVFEKVDSNTVVMKDAPKATSSDTDTKTEETTETTTETITSGSSDTNVNTGDSVPVMLLMLLGFVSFVALFVLRKRVAEDE